MENMCSNCGFYKTPPLFWGGSTEPSLCDCPKEKSYSEEDMKSAFKVGFSIGYERDVHAINENNRICKEWFEQFKKI